MKLNPLLIAAVSAFTIVVLPKPAEAFPFKRNCASMQSYFNSLKWDPPVKFEGFGAREISITRYPGFENPIERASCDNGYGTEYSPMGKKVCLAYIEYFRNSTIRDEAKWHHQHIFAPSCRYR